MTSPYGCSGCDSRTCDGRCFDESPRDDCPVCRELPEDCACERMRERRLRNQVERELRFAMEQQRRVV